MLRHGTGTIEVGDVPLIAGMMSSSGTSQPAGASLLDAVRSQQALTSNPTDRTAVGTVLMLMDQLLRSTNYSAVQSASDDLLASEQDGLLSMGSAQPPVPTSDVNAAVIAVREDLAKAGTAVKAGDMATANAAIADAKTQAQGAKDKALAMAQAQTGVTSLPLDANALVG